MPGAMAVGGPARRGSMVQRAMLRFPRRVFARAARR
jgi:hypothetical protein